MVGDGAAGEGQALARLASAAGWPHSIVLLGWQPAASLPGLLAAMDAALFPVADTPLNRAKSPMRLLDALAAGLPVAAQAVGEYGEYVVDGESGLLAPPDDEAHWPRRSCVCWTTRGSPVASAMKPRAGWQSSTCGRGWLKLHWWPTDPY